MDLNVNGKQYDREENVMTGFREHLKNLATFDLNMNIVAYLLFWFPLSIPFLHPSAWPVQP
jgi:hypothetical protein